MQLRQRFDITDTVRVGRENELVVAVYDATGAGRHDPLAVGHSQLHPFLRASLLRILRSRDPQRGDVLVFA